MMSEELYGNSHRLLVSTNIVNTAISSVITLETDIEKPYLD
jgi:hypothetical protein